MTVENGYLIYVYHFMLDLDSHIAVSGSFGRKEIPEMGFLLLLAGVTEGQNEKC